ncbi:MAG: SDR family NAD(P)-dependent oxidoreductase, partial [Chloroflexi bacterium]|nr:SDR family NAD(P)-dependent oxidoreductase [Chloroflexota bacterium]
MELGLENKVAMVAAASKGLGFGVARALAQDGARVSICSRDADAIEAAAADLRSPTGASVLATACDVRNPADIQSWVDRTVAEWGQVDALLVNAGGPPAAYFVEVDDDQWQAAFDLTLMSSVRLIRA